MLLNAFDVDPGAAERTVELRSGELFALDLQVDLLVVSVCPGSVAPVAGTLGACVEQACGLVLADLPRALDFSGSALGSWISPPLAQLPQPPRWPENSRTRFARLAVIESPPAKAVRASSWSAFRQLFSLLALLPLQENYCPVVAAPLLSAGNLGTPPQQLFPALLERCRDGFRHVPDLQRLIVFDRQRPLLESLAGQIDAELGRLPAERELLRLVDAPRMPEALLGTLACFQRLHPQFDGSADLAELHHLLAGQEITPVALGFHGRRVVERLVRDRLGWQCGTLYQGIQALSRQDLNPWILSCLHQVRVFGNWMGHPNAPGQRRAVALPDVSAMLMALQRVLEDYPW